MKTYDAIIVGAGHNGLTNGAFLAKAGLDVLVLEKMIMLEAPLQVWSCIRTGNIPIALMFAAFFGRKYIKH